MKQPVILGPYPPPYGGVAIVAKQEYQPGKNQFVGTARTAQEDESLHLIQKGRFLQDLPRLLWTLGKRRQSISSIRAHYATTFGFVAAAARFLYRIPYEIVCHGTDVLVNLDRWPHLFFTRAALRGADTIFVVSRALEEKVRAAGYQNVQRIQETIDTQLFKPVKTRWEPVVLYVGRIAPEKGVDLLIKAFKELPVQYSLRLVGPAENKTYLHKLNTQIKALRLEERVEFQGEQTPEQVAGWMQRAGLFVLPSRVEGYGRVLQEALACGTPCVAARVGGIPEVAKGTNCVLVEPTDANALAAGMKKALNTRL